MRGSGSGLAPQLRIQRRTTGQRRFLARARAEAQGLFEVPRMGDESAQRTRLERRLGPLREALFQAPYYAETLRGHGLSPHDLQSLEDLRHFPILTRQCLQARGPDLIALPQDHAEARDLVEIQTSGSTGEPVSVIKDGYDGVHMWSVLRFWLEATGVALPPRPRVVLLCSLGGGIEYSVRLPLLEDGALHRISLIRPAPAAKLRRAGASVLFANPAGLHWLASRQDVPLPSLVLTSAQYFAPAQRALFHEAAPVPVVNYYSTTETGPIAWECLSRHGRFHLLLPDVWVESVGGELLVTRLRSSALPLLRYRTGDRGELVREDCGCGYHGWSILAFSGRRACAFLRPDGRDVDAWSLAWLFKHYALRDFRLSQTAPNAFLLDIRPAAGAFDPRDLQARLISSLEALGWEHPSVAIGTQQWHESSGQKPEPFRTLCSR